MNYINKIITLLILTLSIVSCSESDDITNGTADLTGAIDINFDAKVGDEDFALDTPFSIDNNIYEFSKLRYWVSNIQLVAEDNSVVTIPNSYFLLEETKEISVQEGAYTYPENKRELVSLQGIPQNTYTKLIFAVGIDETYNDNMSLQSGELSQLNGMTNVSWMWHTSYIFSSLAGVNTTDAENSTAILVETGLNDNYRVVEVELPTAVEVDYQNTTVINLNVDVLGMLNEVNLTETPKVSANSPEIMTLVANNYKDNTFTVKIAE